MSARDRLPRMLLDLTSHPDPDLVALWIFSLLRDSDDLLAEYLDLWPLDYRPVAQA